MPSPLLYGGGLYFLKHNTGILTPSTPPPASVHYGRAAGGGANVYASPRGRRGPHLRRRPQGRHGRPRRRPRARRCWPSTASTTASTPRRRPSAASSTCAAASHLYRISGTDAGPPERGDDLPTTTAKLTQDARDAREAARERLDAWVREVVAWHFDPATGTPFWLDCAAARGLRPAPRGPGATPTSTASAPSRTSGCAAGPCGAGCRKGLRRTSPISVFETGGSTGVPKSRINIDDFRIDYEAFSDTLPDAVLPEGRRLAAVGPSGPAPAAPRRRAPLPAPRRHLLHGGPRPALGDQAHQGGRAWRRWRRYKQHVIDQALTLLRAHDSIRCLFTTPEAARGAVREDLAQEGSASPASSAAARR